jgi:hypothetical protein
MSGMLWKICPSATAITVITAKAPSEPTKDMNPLDFMAKRPATKKVLSPISDRKISEKASRVPLGRKMTNDKLQSAMR